MRAVETGDPITLGNIRSKLQRDVKDLEVEGRLPLAADQELRILLDLLTLFARRGNTDIIPAPTHYAAALRIAELGLYADKDIPKGTAARMVHRLSVAHYLPPDFSTEEEEKYVTGVNPLPSASVSFGVCKDAGL